MPRLEWRTELENDLARMDAAHREFVDLFNALATASGENLLSAYDAFVAHVEAHFAEENRWMEAVDFPGCHRAEHDRVLTLLHDIRARMGKGDLFFAKRLLEELPTWFEQHTNGMDAALAFHLNSIGFDVDSESMAEGSPLPAHGGACSHLATEEEAGG